MDEQSHSQLWDFVHSACKRGENRCALTHDERADQYVAPCLSKQFLDDNRRVPALRCRRLGAGPDKLRINVAGTGLGASIGTEDSSNVPSLAMSV